MERKRNVKNHDSQGQRRHRARDAYELYELEHMPRTLQMKVPNIDRAKPCEDETFKPRYYEAGGTVLINSWSQKKEGNHGHQRHRQRDAYELYELEHMPRTLLHIKVPNMNRAKPREVETLRPHNHETGRMAQNSWSQTKDGSGGSYTGNIDVDAEAFIRLRHEKFELIWMSMNGQ